MPILQVSSGIACSNDVREFFEKLKAKREYRYITFKIRSGSKNRAIVIDKCGDRDSSFMDFIKDLPKADGRYAVYDFSYITPEWGVKDGLLFIYWCPFSSAQVEGRTIYSSSKSSILNELRSSMHLRQIEVTELEDMNEANLMDALKPLRDKGIDLALGRVC